MIKSINNAIKDLRSTAIENKVPEVAAENKKAAEAKKLLDPAVKLDIGNRPETPPAYGRYRTVQPDMKSIEALQKEAEDALAPLRQMVEELLTSQGKAFKRANLKATEGEMVEITPEMRAEAQKNISEGGAFSVENTANRLFEFAKAISGGDKSKADQLKESIQEGFKQAEEAWGGALPDISKQTLELALKKVDDWSKEV